jgi:hypothetical protein
LGYGNFLLNAEYAYKINDPNATNNYIYRSGDAQFLSASYAKKGLAVSGSVSRADNMGYRSQTDQSGNNLLINYVPAINKNHTYSLLTFYPYASQFNGQFEVNGEIAKKLVKKPNYKLDVLVNYSAANDLDTISREGADISRQGYITKSWGPGKTVIFRDFYTEINQKIGKKIKTSLMYAYQVYNKGLLQKPGFPTIYSNIVVADISYRLKKERNIRMELQHLATKQDHQNWAMALLEYTISSQWFIAVLDQYNYGNYIKGDRLHYPNATIGFNKNANRITLGYGKQRAGIFCVGGICRQVPASNGVTLTVSSTF